MENLYETSGTFTPDNLFAGNSIPVVARGIVLAKNQGVIKRGTVVGIITASELAVPVDKAKEDGSQIPYGITTDTIDTDIAVTDIKTTAYVTGLFNAKALSFGAADIAKDHEVKLRELGIHLQDNI
jgi:Bacteriophage lambda head decoration protein D